MSAELILQILVFPAIGMVWLKVSAIEARLAAGEQRFTDIERRVQQLESRNA